MAKLHRLDKQPIQMVKKEPIWMKFRKKRLILLFAVSLLIIGFFSFSSLKFSEVKE